MRALPTHSNSSSSSGLDGSQVARINIFGSLLSMADDKASNSSVC
jgi:hypothetical protein